MPVLFPVFLVLAHRPEYSRHAVHHEKLRGSVCFQRIKACAFIHVAVISGASDVRQGAALVTPTSPQVSRPAEFRDLGEGSISLPPSPIKVVPLLLLLLFKDSFIWSFMRDAEREAGSLQGA